MNHRALVLVAAAALSGCATLDVSKDRPTIEALLTERGAGNLGWENNGTAESDTLLANLRTKPMTLDLAIRAAMLKSPQLQQVYGQLGLARADVLDAIQVANPRVGVSSLALAGGPGSQFVASVAQPLVDLLTLPAKSRLAHLDYERARYDVAASILGVSLDVESGWYRDVAAQQVASMRSAVADALQTSADLAQRFYDAGNITELQLNREKAAATQARIDAATASVGARISRLDLNTAIGLTGGETGWNSQAALPLPLATEDDPAELQRIASTTSLELLAARKGASVAAGAASITRHFRLLGATTIGYDREREVDRSVIRGPTLDLELPIFNQGGSRVARAEARLQIARARLARIELSSKNAVALGAERVLVLSEIVKDYREALVPERETVASRSQLEQNFALIGEFEVLQARAQQYAAYQGLIEAVRDYWLARVDLTRLIGSRLPSDAQPRPGNVSAQQYLTPPADSGMGGMEHQHHHGGAAMPMEPGGPASKPDMSGIQMHEHGASDAAPPTPGPAQMHQHETPSAPPVPPPSAEHHHGAQQ